jgi:glyoxylase-like metal-dependent hydrolase (beta-lactamase superfamily II)
VAGWTTEEVAPGIWRIESVLGPRPFSQYLLRGERTLLVDSGVKETPAEVVLPALGSLGVDPGRLDYVLVSHADVDHFGGNEAVRAAAPDVIVLAHAADAPWIESRELIMRERYGWYEAFGIAYDSDTFAWLRDAMGAEVPVDLRLRGDEEIRLGPGLAVRVLHLPGHSPGHVGLWEPASRTAIVLDAVMARGLLDTDGNVIHPPPVVDTAGYERSIRLLQELGPARLLTAHYALIEGEEVGRFLAESLEFLRSARAAVKRALDADPQISLRELVARADAELGPFTSMPNELGATLRGVLHEQGREAR